MNMAAGQRSFAKLLEEVRAGSESAAWELVERYEPHIRSVLARGLGPQMRTRLDSIDLAQAAWLSFFRHRSRLAQIDQPKELVGFITAIVRNKLRHAVRDHHRACRDVRRGVPLGAATSGDSALEAHVARPSQVVSARERWQTLMDRLPEHYRRMVELRSRGATFVEIARTLGCAERTVRRVMDSIERDYLEIEI